MSDAGAELILTGYDHSVYTRSVRIALAEKGQHYTYVERNPFDPSDLLDLMLVHPFGRVPVLSDDGFRVYETSAILAYVDAAFEGPSLTPSEIRKAARMRQVISLTASYVYQPLVRQAFSHGVYRPLMAESADTGTLRAGLDAAPRVLDALEEIAREGLILCPEQMCLASCHLYPMLDYFDMVPEGRALLSRRDALSTWMHWMGRRASVVETRLQLTATGGTV